MRGKGLLLPRLSLHCKAASSRGDAAHLPCEGGMTHVVAIGLHQ